MTDMQVKQNGHNVHDEDEDEETSIHFEPLISPLPKIEVKRLEEDEDILFKIRAKIFRLDDNLDPCEWKERGVGDVTIVQHKDTKHIRLVMYREKVLKLCANHSILPEMELVPNCGSDRAWLWKTPCDYSEEDPRPEVLAIRFANSENAQKFKEHFDNARGIMRDLLKLSEISSTRPDVNEPTQANTNKAEEITEGLTKLSVNSKDNPETPATVCQGDTLQNTTVKHDTKQVEQTTEK